VLPRPESLDLGRRGARLLIGPVEAGLDRAVVPMAGGEEPGRARDVLVSEVDDLGVRRHGETG
jgi:hypothetical protein